MCSKESVNSRYQPVTTALLYGAALLLIITLFAQPAYAAAEVPPDFRLVTSASGVQLYRKDYKNGTPDFVQVINLSLGAEIVPMHGKITETREGKGVYGGSDPRLRSQPLNKYWQDLQGFSTDAFCVSNGQFFYMLEYPTRLPFPLRVDSQVVTDGYGLRNYPNQKLLLLLWPNKADIVYLDKATLYGTSAPHAIAGLTEDARKSPTKYVGRTFVGVDDLDGDGAAEIVLVFSTRSARQKDAASVLRSFGADKVMMLDGGGSAQLTCQGKAYVASERPIPQAIGVLAAPDEPLILEQIIAGPTLSDPTPTEIEVQTNKDAVLSENVPTTVEAVDITAQQSEIPDLSPIYSFDFQDVVWVPAAMAPVMALVLILIVRQRLSV